MPELHGAYFPQLLLTCANVTSVPPTSQPPGDHYTERQIAEKLGISRYWVAEQAKARRLPHLKIGNRRRYTEDQYQQILGMLSVPVVDPLARSPRSRKGRAA